MLRFYFFTAKQGTWVHKDDRGPWHDFVIPYVIIIFRRVIFSDASISGFQSELIIRSLLHAFVAIFNAFLKSFDAESLVKM